MNLTERQKQIVECSIDLIAELGIQKLTMKRVAEAIGVTEPAVYRHFPNKQAILTAILTYFSEIRSDLLDASIEHTPFERIERFVLGLFDLFASKPSLARLMFAEEYIPNDPSMARQMMGIMHGHREQLTILIRSAQTDGKMRNDIPPLQVFRLIIGPVRLLIAQWCLTSRAFDLKAEGEEVWSAMKRVLRP
jgi:AcrR family transcriptional regulator